MYDKLVIVVLISSVTIYSMTNSAEKTQIVSSYLVGWANCQMTLMGFSEKRIHTLCLVCPNFQGDFFFWPACFIPILPPQSEMCLMKISLWWKMQILGSSTVAGAGLGFSPSSLPQPRLGPLHLVLHHCQPFFVSASRLGLVVFSVCSSVQHWTTSWKFGSSGNVGLQRPGWQQGWVLLKCCGWLREVHQCAHWWVQPHFHHVQNEGKFYLTFPLDPHLQSAEMGHGWWQRGCVGSSWLLKVRGGAGSQTVRAFTSTGLEPGDVGALEQEMARNRDGARGVWRRSMRGWCACSSARGHAWVNYT